MSAAMARDGYEKMAKERMSEGGKSAGKSRPKQGMENLPHPIERTGSARDQVGKDAPVPAHLPELGSKADTLEVAETFTTTNRPSFSIASLASLLRCLGTALQVWQRDQ